MARIEYDDPEAEKAFQDNDISKKSPPIKDLKDLEDLGKGYMRFKLKEPREKKAPLIS